MKLVFSNNNINILHDSLSTELSTTKDNLADSLYQNDSLRAELKSTKDELSKLIELEKIAEESLAEADPSDVFIPLVSQDFIDQVKFWTQTNSTLAFPCNVKVLNSAVTLADSTLSSTVEVDVGGELVVTRFHPVSEVYVVARIGDNENYMASVHVDNTNLIENLAEKYVDHMSSIGKEVVNPFVDNRFSQIDQNLSEE